MPDSRLSYAAISLLYVEDEPSTREKVSRLLASRGYRLTVAEDGQEGLDFFKKQTPDIVLTDIMMPKLSGLEMSRAIRALSPDMQIACMTAFSDSGYMIEAIDIGINQFVLKPVEFHRLFTALDRCQEMVELRKRKEKLEEENLHAKKFEAIGILAGGIAHDFNNLLQIILGYVSLARMNAEPGSKTESLLSIVEQTSESARELGTRLLTFSRGGHMCMEATQLRQYLKEDVEAELESTPAIELFFDLPDDLPTVKLDIDQIRQVIISLATNAREAMPGGGSLYVSASTATLIADNSLALPPGNYLHVSFEDTGVGILPENMPKIFDPYFSTKEMGTQKGMGLGLAICYSIIKHHNGHIHAESRPGEGTRIHIYLPVYHPDE
ncbi:MAG: response regulator [Geobacteraceae bacterium]|nr:response regulator [Geobacteraceae bacterium]